jgi:sugar phosphate isomerase/epimerase
MPELDEVPRGELNHASRGDALPKIATSSSEAQQTPGIGVGLDTGTLLLAGLNPAKFISRLATRLPGQPAQLRLTDAAASRRVPPGDGELDELSVDVACQVAGYKSFAVIDLRGIPAADLVIPRLWSL